MTTVSTTTTFLTHNKIQLALHHLRPEGTSGRPLLLLHGLGESSVTKLPGWAADWAGPVVALDFTGHGESTVPSGGGYSAEILLADADIALESLRPPDGGVTVVGRGLGAYIALLLAGSRPQRVHGAVLCDGPGLAGGAISPTSQSFVLLPPRAMPPDPYALFELSRDLRPPDYATLFARMAAAASPLDEPIAIAAMVRPAWLEAIAKEVGVVTTGLAEAMQMYAA